MTFFLLYIEKIICAKGDVINSQNSHVDKIVEKAIINVVVKKIKLGLDE